MFCFLFFVFLVGETERVYERTIRTNEKQFEKLRLYVFYPFRRTAVRKIRSKTTTTNNENFLKKNILFADQTKTQLQPTISSFSIFEFYRQLKFSDKIIRRAALIRARLLFETRVRN
jgi:hypothetical protein